MNGRVAPACQISGDQAPDVLGGSGHSWNYPQSRIGPVMGEAGTMPVTVAQCWVALSEDVSIKQKPPDKHEKLKQY